MWKVGEVPKVKHRCITTIIFVGLKERMTGNT